MRRVLVDHARSRNSQKRGGAWKRITMLGLSQEDGAEEEIAEHLGVSRNTVVRELSLPRAWLRRELTRGE
ncbi:MAG: hypothetical protein GY711_16925 [bacterium]|nr:hypothetical protein [bacterium]